MAIQTEIDGYTFYQTFAERTEDPNARVVFERLAQDEAMHLELLQNTKTMLEDSGQWAEFAGLDTGGHPGGAHLFSGACEAECCGLYI